MATTTRKKTGSKKMKKKAQASRRTNSASTGRASARSKTSSTRKSSRKKTPRSLVVERKPAPRKRPPRLNGISDIRRFFYRNETPVYFVSATNFNLLGIDEWVRNFSYINNIDCFDGQHPNVLVPAEKPHRTFQSIEDINNYLLSHKEVIDEVTRKGGGKAVFLMFDQETEQLCRDIGLEVCFPPASLREAIDNKIETTRIADRAGVKSVPNVLAKVGSYSELRKVSRRLGQDLVVQTAFGDSGHTTFFISSEADFKKHEDEIIEAPEVKIMKRINCRGSALEACVTRHGTIVGPLMTELVGFKELTPYKGGWCGNEVFAGAFDRRIRNHARRSAVAFGEELRKMGYRGYFEIDFLTDLDNGKVYLGEVNPRIAGASSMTNLAAFAQADAPLFLFHLLEWMDVDYTIDVHELNKHWANPDYIDAWSQLVIKHTSDDVDRITDAPQTGIWELDSRGRPSFKRVQTHRRTVQDESQAFYLRISGPGDYRYEGADLGILVSRGRFMTDDFKLNRNAKRWIKAIRGLYEAEPVGLAEAMPVQHAAEVAQFKMM